MTLRCLECREPLRLSELGAEVEGGLICDACDARYPEPLRPSLGGAVAYLERDPNVRPVPNSASESYSWPLVDAKRHPHKAERRDGPRSDSYFARLAQT